ncbi:MAG: glycosyltransferase family 4 protein [Pseudomonadota bacterium]
MTVETIDPALAPAVERLRAAGVGRRVVCVTGHGDVLGTFAHWREGRDEPRTPNTAYSAQLYDVARALGSDALVLPADPASILDPVEVRGARFTFRPLPLVEGTGWRYHAAAIAQARAITRAARQHRADLIIVQRGLLHTWPLIGARAGGMRVAISLHNTLWPLGLRPSRSRAWAGRLSGALWNRVFDTTVVASDAIRRQLEETARGPIRNLHLQLPFYDPARLGAPAARPAADGPAHVVFLGRIERSKGVFTLVEAAERLIAAGRALRVSIAGDGAALGALRETVARSPAAGAIDVMGRIDGEAVFALVDTADALACPTTPAFPEGFAMVVVEAWLKGVPVVASDVVPAAEHLPDGVVTHRAGDAASLAEGLARILDDRATGGPLARRAPPADDRFTAPRLSLSSRLIDGLDIACHAPGSRPASA